MLESVRLLGQFSERLLRLIRRKNLQWLQWQLLQGFLQQISIGIGDILASARISATDWSLMCKDSCDGYWDPLMDQNKNVVVWFLGWHLQWLKSRNWPFQWLWGHLLGWFVSGTL